MLPHLLYDDTMRRTLRRNDNEVFFITPVVLYTVSGEKQDAGFLHKFGKCRPIFTLFQY